MRFQEYLQEEYFTRTEKFEIFKNPSNKEIRELFRIRKAMRALVDFKNLVYFLFDSDLLHQSASKIIAKEYDGEGYFFPLEIWEKNNKINVRIADDLFKIKAKQSRWINGFDFPEPSRKEFKWIESKFKILGKLNEAYFTSFKDKKKYIEIFKNPSNKEISKIKFHDYVRFIVNDNDIYAASSDTTHSEMLKHLKKEGVVFNDYFLILGYYGNGKLELLPYTVSNKDAEKIKNIFKNLNLLNEEYCSRKWDKEIFKNPNKSEINETSREDENRSIRFFVTKDKDWFIFPSSLLHSDAIKHLFQEGEISSGIYEPGEITFESKLIRLYSFGGVYEVTKNGKVRNFIRQAKKEDFLWILEKLKVFNKPIRYDGIMYEEYFSRSKKAEVFKNPNMKEYKDAEKASMKDDKHGFIRLLIDIKTHDVYVSSGTMLHDEIAEVIDKEDDGNTSYNYENHYYPLVGHIKGDTLHLTNSSVVKFNQDEIKEIIEIMEKKTYYKISYRNR